MSSHRKMIKVDVESWLNIVEPSTAYDIFMLECPHWLDGTQMPSNNYIRITIKAMTGNAIDKFSMSKVDFLSC